MHQIFTIREILDGILLGMSRSQLTNTVSVNRIWFLASLRGLWQEVKLSEVLKVLGEISESLPNASYFLKFEPSPAQCYRFFMYSQHVRILVGYEYDIYTLANAVAAFRSNVQCFFPNLRSLEWELPSGRLLIEKFPAADLTIFISPGLKTFSVELQDIPFPFFRSICDTLITRVRDLRILKICVNSTYSRQSEDPAECVESFGRVLQSFRQTLVHVTLPAIFHTEEIVKQLGQIRGLYNLVIGITSINKVITEQGPYRYLRNENDREETVEYFGRLDTLHINGSQQALCNGFLGKQMFSSLTDIYWNQCMEIVDPESFVTTIVNAYPNLCNLVVGEPDAYQDKDDLPSIIPWRTIRILLGCHLAGLSLHCCRVSMDPEDWIELLTSCDDWEDIRIYSVTPLRLSELPVFSRYCPSLEALGIHVDVCSINNIDPNGTPLPPSIISPNVALTLTQSGCEDPANKFHCLEFVNFGYSLYYPDLRPKIESFILGMCTSTIIVSGWDWPLLELQGDISDDSTDGSAVEEAESMEL